MSRFVVTLLLISLIALSLFGLWAFLATPAHSAHCAHTMHGSILCSFSILTHLEHWQTAVVSMVTANVLLILLALSCGLVVVRVVNVSSFGRLLLRTIPRVPLRPTLLQELFSQGILHPKKPESVPGALIILVKQSLWNNKQISLARHLLLVS